MAWFMMGIAVGWAVGGIYWYNQTEDEKAGNGASIVGVALFLIAVVVGISLGVSSGIIGPDATPTPTIGGR